MSDPSFHTFHTDLSAYSLPKRFTNPFRYVPDPLCRLAAAQVEDYIEHHAEVHRALSGGKMLGVLVVKNLSGEVGYLSAYSGNDEQLVTDRYFAPPVFNILSDSGFFKKGEAKIEQMNREIDALRLDSRYVTLKNSWRHQQDLARKELQQWKAHMEASKRERDRLRAQGTDVVRKEQLIRESQFQKAEYKRMLRRNNEKLQAIQREIDVWEVRIARLKQNRKGASEQLQHEIFRHFHFLNALGQEAGLLQLFRRSGINVPPAGAGECAAPRLLQHAFAHRYVPIAMGEWWHGQPDVQKLRRTGDFYPACTHKCLPILRHMLCGLPLQAAVSDFVGSDLLQILYEDDWIIAVNKPCGMLSVPGKGHQVDVVSVLVRQMPALSQPFVVHRLDMDTSGILLIAKQLDVYKALQELFANRLVEKQYIALVDGYPPHASGCVSLPMLPDYENRPRQQVDISWGKEAMTRYEVLGQMGGYTRVRFVPLTGRTHQLRVHAAHPQGLNAPIVGDMLYGTGADRLYLHACKLHFLHPVTHCPVCIHCPPPF